MTRVVAVPPIDGALLAQGVTGMVAVRFDSACPTCEGAELVMRPDLHDTLGRCLACLESDNDAVRVSLRSGPFTALIGTTSEDPGTDRRVIDDRWALANYKGVRILAGRRDFGCRRILSSSIPGAATVELLPIIDSDDEDRDPCRSAVVRDGDTLTLVRCIGDMGTGPDWVWTDVSHALPYGDWTPGNTALIVTDFRPAFTCPDCGGTGGAGYVGDAHGGAPWDPCPTCWPRDETGAWVGDVRPDDFTKVAGSLRCPRPWAAPDRAAITELEERGAL